MKTVKLEGKKYARVIAHVTSTDDRGRPKNLRIYYPEEEVPIRQLAEERAETPEFVTLYVFEGAVTNVN